MKTSFKTGDTVRILSGDEKGKTAKVLKMDRETGKVLLEGINMLTHYERKSEKNPTGGITKREGMIRMCKVVKVESAEKDSKKDNKKEKPAKK